MQDPPEVLVRSAAEVGFVERPLRQRNLEQGLGGGARRRLRVLLALGLAPQGKETESGRQAGGGLEEIATVEFVFHWVDRWLDPFNDFQIARAKIAFVPCVGDPISFVRPETTPTGVGAAGKIELTVLLSNLH